MEWIPQRPTRRVLCVALLLTATLAQSGCVGAVAVLLYRGRIAPAACDKLEGQRVAVVCTGDSGDFGPNPNASLVAKAVGRLLDENVKKVDVVNHKRIEAWLDEHAGD